MTIRSRKSPSFGKRVFFWGILLLGAVMLFFVLIVLIAPRAINRDAVRSRIEATISKELGGTVTYDRAKLVLIPRPQIEFQNLKIAIPVNVSATIAQVKIYAKLLPLLRRRFEVSSITLDRPALALVLPDTGRVGNKRTKQKTRPAAPTVSSVLAVAGRAMPDLSLTILQGRFSVVRNGRKVLSVADLESVLAFIPEPQKGQEPPDQASDDHYHITGKAQAVISEIAALPGPLRISIARFDAYPKSVVISQSRARLLDMDMTLSGSVEDYLSTAPRSNIVFNGSIEQDASYWIRTLAGLPEEVIVRTPLKVQDVRLRSSGTGSTSSLSLAGSVMVKDGAAISFALRHEPDRLDIERLQVKDSESDAVLRLMSGKKDLDLAFSGTLTGETLSRIVDRQLMPFKRITGDIHAHIPRDRWSEVMAEGALEGEGLIIPSPLTGSFVVDRFSVRAQGGAVDLRPVVLSIGQDTLTAEGTASLSETGVAVDLDVSTDRITMASLLELMERKKPSAGSSPQSAPDKMLNVEGELRLNAASVVMNKYTAVEVSLILSFRKGRTTVDLEHASLCGIDLHGALKTNDHEMEITLQPKASGRQLDEDLQCLFQEELLVTGSYDLSGSITGRGSWKALLPSLQGNFDFSAKQGRIQSARIVKGVIAYLNSTSLLKGSRSELLQEGVPYETIVLRGTLHDGVISLKEGIIKSKEIHITAEGDLDLRKGTLALTVLAAPFTTMDQLLSKIPIVKHLAGSALIVVPVRVEGTFQEPRVKPLPVSGVGTNVSNLMKNIVQAPVKIIEPVIPKEFDKESYHGKDQL